VKGRRLSVPGADDNGSSGSDTAFPATGAAAEDAGGGDRKLQLRRVSIEGSISALPLRRLRLLEKMK
jgi:hypothetical protein